MSTLMWASRILYEGLENNRNERPISTSIGLLSACRSVDNQHAEPVRKPTDSLHAFDLTKVCDLVLFIIMHDDA